MVICFGHIGISKFRIPGKLMVFGYFRILFQYIENKLTKGENQRILMKNLG